MVLGQWLLTHSRVCRALGCERINAGIKHADGSVGLRVSGALPCKQNKWEQISSLVPFQALGILFPLCKPGLLAGLFCTWPVLSPGDAAPLCEHRCGVGAAHRSHCDRGTDRAAALSALLTVAKPVVTSVFPALPFTPNCVSIPFPGIFF